MVRISNTCRAFLAQRSMGWKKEGELSAQLPISARVRRHDIVVGSYLRIDRLVTDLEDAQLTFNVQVLEGDLAGADGPASLFIDTPDYEISALQSMFPSTNWPPGMRQPPSMQH